MTIQKPVRQTSTASSSDIDRVINAGTAIPNSERIYVVSADHISSIKLNFNEKSRMSASENLEFAIADVGSPPPALMETLAAEKDIKFQMVISPELCQLIDDARKPTKTSRRSWLLQAAQEKLEREGKLR
jgi:hypothetical protein